MHTKALERFNFDSVLLPFSFLMAQNEQYLGDFLDCSTSICQARNVALQTIKSIVHKPWEDRAAQNRNTWYRPLENQADIDLAVHWVLGHSRVILEQRG